MGAPPGGAKDYPLQIGLAYLFMVGYLVRTLFVSVGLPASVGVIITGFAFTFFFQVELFAARDELQELAFFLVLLTAGLEIRLRDLRLFIFTMAFLPATLEILAIATYALLMLQFSFIEGLVMGTILVGIGDGLVIPKMKEFGVRFQGHPMPRLVFIWAPLEASFALALFGILTGFAAPANSPSFRIVELAAGNIMRITATVALGALLGTVSGYLVSRRTQLTLRGNQVFNGTAVEAFLMVLAVGLFAFGMGSEGIGGREVIPVRLCPGSLFQPELVVIMTGIFFAATADREVLHDVERTMGGVWIFGQLILFSMLGSRTSLNIFPQFLEHVLPIIVTGLAFRFVGICISIELSLLLNLHGHPFQRSMVLQDACFCFLATIPRATIQGALGQVPVTDRFFQMTQRRNASAAQDFIFTAARLYIVFMSIFGMILLNTFGPVLCEATRKRPAWGSGALEEEEVDAEAGKAQEATSSEGSEEKPSIQAETSTPQERGQDAPPIRTSSEPNLQLPMSPSRREVFRHMLSQRRYGSHAPDLDLVQFDCMGSVYKAVAAKSADEWRGQGARRGPGRGTVQ
uniref:Cation/H+ exchanger domain-containing protein n=1 Tax=Alexandrium catenella TaxID=2925 RepID=A0A7S1Q975_ALECA